MNLRNRRILIDEINDAFIEFLRDYRGRRVAEYIKAINTELIERANELNPRLVREIVRSHTVDVQDIAIFSLILGAITTILENKQLTNKQREQLLPIIAVMSVYAVSKPKLFVSKLYQSLKAPSSANERKVGNILKTYTAQNTKVIERIKREQLKDLSSSQIKAKLSMSKSVIQDIKLMTHEGKPLEMQRHWLKRKYNTNKAIMRAVDTEIHASLEKGKFEQAKVDGFTHKTWKTQEDDRVRKTRWHNHVANQRIPIEEDFKLGSIVANAAGDTRLPVGERINCRCYMIYQ